MGDSQHALAEAGYAALSWLTCLTGGRSTQGRKSGNSEATSDNSGTVVLLSFNDIRIVGVCSSDVDVGAAEIVLGATGGATRDGCEVSSSSSHSQFDLFGASREGKLTV